MRLDLGKIPSEILQEVVFAHLGAYREEVLLGPAAGFDGGVIDVGEKSLVVSMDPITGAVERIGWVAVNINANDVATFGVQPSLLFVCILLPEDSERETVEAICTQVDEAARGLEMAVVGGHCEVTPGLADPIVVGCAMGLCDKGDYVTSGGAKRGDKLILTKTAGIEGTAILALDRERQLKDTIDASTLSEAKRLLTLISVVKEAILSFNSGLVNAMHDPTEGGVFGGIHELADASDLGVRIFEGNIPVRPETTRIAKHFGIDPFQLLSSGALLISTSPKSAHKIVDILRGKNIMASIIGELRADPADRLLVARDGSRRSLPRPATDQIWVALEGRGSTTSG